MDRIRKSKFTSFLCFSKKNYLSCCAQINILYPSWVNTVTESSLKLYRINFSRREKLSSPRLNVGQVLGLRCCQAWRHVQSCAIRHVTWHDTCPCRWETWLYSGRSKKRRRIYRLQRSNNYPTAFFYRQELKCTFFAFNLAFSEIHQESYLYQKQ